MWDTSKQKTELRRPPGTNPKLKQMFVLHDTVVPETGDSNELSIYNIHKGMGNLSLLRSKDFEMPSC